MSISTLYNHIGNAYDTTRRADSYLTNRLAELLALSDEDTCLDVACGSGNYTTALGGRGGIWYGVDASTTMIEQARQKSSDVRWYVADVAALPFESEMFDKAICTLAIHHFPVLDAAFKEVHRVLRSGPFVLFTSLPEQTQRYWLDEYFPEAIRRSVAQLPSLDAIAISLESAGLTITSTEPYSVQPDLQDFFLYSGKFQPSLYLDPAVRAGISTFAALADTAEIHAGCQRLEADIASGRIEKVMDKFADDGGDYIFVVAEKRVV